MIYLAFIVLIFTLIQLVIALANLLFREKPREGKLETEPLISILIPARNEEKNIPLILGDLIAQPYKNIEVIVFDDQSEDNTGKIVNEFSSRDRRIRLLSSAGLPDGWLGKNHACHLLSLQAKGAYFLFADADVRMSDNILRNITAFASDNNLSLVSLFPKQEMVTTGEKITVPVMNFILLSLLPLRLVRKTGLTSLSAANGQFMFYESLAYKTIMPHEELRGNKVEDIGSARLLKSKGYKIACLTGDSTIRCRMYSGFSEAVSGFSKNIGAFFGNSLLLASLFWTVTTLGFIPVVVSMTDEAIILYFLAYLAIRITVSVASEQKIGETILLIIPQQLLMGMMIYRAMVNKIAGNFEWKGRNIK